MAFSDPQAIHPRRKQFKNKFFHFVFANIMLHAMDSSRDPFAAAFGFIQKNKLPQRLFGHDHGVNYFFGRGAKTKDPFR